MNENQKTYTPTEVGTMLESLQSNISVIAEEVSGLSKWRFAVDSRLANLESDMTIVKDAITFPDHVSQIQWKTVESKLAL